MQYRYKPKFFDASDHPSNHQSNSITLPTFINHPNPNRSILGLSKLLHSKGTYFYRSGSRLDYVMPSICVLALLAGNIIMFNPMLNNTRTASAIANKENTALQTAHAAIQPTVSLTITPDNDNTNSNVTADEVAYFSNTITVGGTGITKYIISLNTPSGKTGELIGRANPYVTVGKVAAGTIPADFDDNAWGYAISTRNEADVTNRTSMAYNPTPSGMDSDTNSTAIAKRVGINKTESVEDRYKLAFAAKLSTDVPSDHYEADVYLSIVASSQATISSITNMQDMNSSICAESIEEEAKQLKDTRDEKLYWVTKLKDDNCWMTQNLDYDIKEGDFVNATATKVGDINSGWISGSTQIQSWDPGDYYYKYVSSTNWIGCGAPVSNMSSCPSKGNWAITAPIIGGEHYHVGNYYSWNAATAGTGGSIKTGEASSSICPTGWKLPTSNGAASDFGKLMSAYGLRTDNGSEPNIDKIRQTPIYLIPAGDVNTSGPLYDAGKNGFYWSSTPYSNGSHAYQLTFYSNFLNPSASSDRAFGYSIRCLAK